MHIPYYAWVSFQTLNTLVLNPLTARIPSAAKTTFIIIDSNSHALNGAHEVFDKMPK